MRFRGTVPWEDKILDGQPRNVDLAGLLSDVLDGLQGMTGANWEEECERLADLLRPHVER